MGVSRRADYDHRRHRLRHRICRVYHGIVIDMPTLTVAIAIAAAFVVSAIASHLLLTRAARRRQR